MCVKVLIILLLFGVQLYSGQDVAKIELDNGKEVYEIREIKNNSVELIYPKKDMPILREIIFYKVIEKPYIQETNDQVPIIEKSKDEQEKEEPEFNETRRSFTNGHGLQFLDWENQDENTYNIENKTDFPSENKITNSNNNDRNLAESDESSDVHDNDDNDIDHDKNDSNQNDDNYNNDNNNDKNNTKNDDMFEYYDDDTEDTNKKQLNIENANIKNHDDTDNSQNGNNRNAYEGNDDRNGYDIGKINITKEDGNNENSKEDKTQEEEIKLAKKLREQLLNSTKEKYHSIQRIHRTENQRRRKREVNYRNIPEAPRLPDLDIKSFPSYIQRMLANRPIVGNDDKSVTKNAYDTKLFNKMSGIIPSDNTASGEAKTYGFKYNQGRSTSWNDIHKTQNDHKSNDLDLSGSQTNNPYEVQKPTIDIRDNIPEEDESLSKNKEKNYNSPKNIVPSLDIPVEKDHVIIKKNTENEKRRVTDFNNKENVKTNYMDNGFDIKNRLVNMIHNINSKLLNGQKPRTYGMSLKGDKGEIWNDIAGAPLTNIDNTHNEDVSENESRNNPNKINNFDYEKQNNVNDNKDYDERNPNIPESDNEANNINNIDDAREAINSFINSDKKELDNYDKSNSHEDRASTHEVNVEKTPYEMPPPAPKLPDFKFNEPFITSTNKPEIGNEQVNEHHTTGIPNVLYFTQRSTEKPIKVTEKSKLEEPEVEKEHQPIDNESLRRKMEESFDNIIKHFPKLEPMKEETTGVDNLKTNEPRNNNNKPRTYGMHLEGDHGYVWNDLTNPGTHVNVGDLENIEVTEPSIDEVIPYSSIEESNSVENHSESPIETTPMEYEKHLETSTNKHNEEITEKSITTTTERESVTERENNVTTEKTIDNELDDKKDCTCKNDTLTKEKVESDNNNNETESIKVTLDDLLKKDEFWQWLSNWTTTYMDVLNEQVEKLVEDKVAKRFENNDKNNNDKNNNNDEVDPDRNNNKNNDTIKIDKETDNDGDNDSSKNPNSDQLKINNNNSNINNDEKEKPNSTEIQSEKDLNNSNESGTATEKSDIKPISEDKIDSTVEDMNKKKNNTLPFDIKADTIYGNSMNSDHVTNIFIFYPDVKLNKTIDQSEPLINKNNLAIEKPANVTFDERIDIPENDKDNQINKPDTSTEISSSQSNTETVIDVTSTTESPTTTEELTKNTPKEIEESKNDNNPKPQKIKPEKVKEKVKDDNEITEKPKTDNEMTTTKTENSKETTKLSDKEATTESIKTESEKDTTSISDNEVTTELPKPENDKNTTKLNEKETTTDSSKKDNDKEITKHDDKDTTIENDKTTKVDDDKTTTPTSDDNITTTNKSEIPTESSTNKPSDSDTTEDSTDSKHTSDVTSTEKSISS